MRSPPLPRSELPSLAQAASSNRASLEDLREYLPCLANTDLSETQKLEMLRTVWSIMSTFVDLAFGADPVQQALIAAVTDEDADKPIVR